MNEEILVNTESKMNKVIEALETNLKSIRTGRASTGMLDGIIVNYYGTKTPLTQLGSVSAPDANLLLVTPWDKGALKEVEKAIMEADLGFNPNNDGSVIRIPVPQLTAERRKEMAKQVKKVSEEFKIQIRNIRRDNNEVAKKLEKENASKDVIEELVEGIQKLTDKYIKLIEEKANNKEKSIMEI